jgi:hypothetical protein
MNRQCTFVSLALLLCVVLSATVLAGPVVVESSRQVPVAASLASAARHRDTDPPSKLNDGVFGSAVTDSVQYDGDVAIIADLRAVQEIKTAQLLIFHRDNDFSAESVAAETSNDKRQWTAADTFKCDAIVGEWIVVSVSRNA